MIFKKNALPLRGSVDLGTKMLGGGRDFFVFRFLNFGLVTLKKFPLKVNGIFRGYSGEMGQHFERKLKFGGQGSCRLLTWHARILCRLKYGVCQL